MLIQTNLSQISLQIQKMLGVICEKASSTPCLNTKPIVTKIYEQFENKLRFISITSNSGTF